MLTVASYVVYIAISLGVTIWVAQTLHKNGRAFLVDSFGENETLADSVNHLLVVGFYLINLGYMSLVLRMAQKPASVAQAIELLSAKIGWVLLVLGGMHFLNIYVFSRFRRSAMAQHFAPPLAPGMKISRTTAGS